MHEQIQISPGQMFRPRYDIPSRDCERLEAFVVELLHAGEIQRLPGTSLFDSHIQPAFERVLDGYFTRRLFDQIEEHLTYSEAYNKWPYEGDLARWRQLADAGQTQRVVRLWRNHIACVKSGFWYRIHERKAGYRKPKYSGMSDAHERNSYNKLIGQIPSLKDDILGLMAFARYWFERMEVPDAQLKRLAAERAEVEAEERRQPEGKPDSRAMDADVFWEVIGTPEQFSVPAQVEAVAGRLERLKASAIKAFDKHLQTLAVEAYRDDVWALAYLLYDGCSDDSFEAFRCWLVLQGRTVFEATLGDPDTFDLALFRTDFEGAVALIDVPQLAYEVRTGKALKRARVRAAQLKGETLTEEMFAMRLPRVAAQLKTKRV